ncbi:MULTISPECIES: 4Fe-4S binding protein [Methanosarcina]|jgi:ferredoxin|uniref:4Fe-4S dicluster domain-containing protein n=8 Tax=Methanosarcina mazei TaxID=2209 RepID=A0A0F8RC01_METMZ|nr:MULTISPECIES: 4Fe-4S binding protein [Methanosarcina]AAM30456.1 Ferredoxin [Methanosarcina mazei Go1]AGF96189.1 Ferredoxin [Methanosarcina mazei Tuc01]AKB39552.1 Ferredoxin [Methanosarcina mazei WWM610]AKB60522.1 Ferredoxin [Methanosarcina mazei SarPi]AKB63754.1 Ferredoxin [Methanosarcina mazei S-6]
MVAKIDADACTGCGTCVDECPAAAISLNDDDIAVVDEDECLDCGACVDACPNGAITLE